MDDEDDLLGGDFDFGNDGAWPGAAVRQSWGCPVPEGQDPEAPPPKKKKKKELDFAALSKHGYEGVGSMEESETYKKIQQVRPF